MIISNFAPMDDDLKLAKESVQLIKKDFLLEEEIELAGDQPFDRLKYELTRIISYLLNTDMPRLMNAMYRIDISESRFAEILQSAPPDEVASQLADAIIAREKQKVKLRRKYSS